MANMSYCRFENTLKDLQDCHENWFEPENEDEIRAREKLLKLCRKVVTDYIDCLPKDER